MSTEYRAIVRLENGREVPFNYIFAKPDVNWGGYFHNLRAHQVVRWESHEVRSDGSATAWAPIREEAPQSPATEPQWR